MTKTKKTRTVGQRIRAYYNTSKTMRAEGTIVKVEDDGTLVVSLSKTGSFLSHAKLGEHIYVCEGEQPWEETVKLLVKKGRTSANKAA